MTNELAFWQERLENHFKLLFETRMRESPNGRVFALEHGLSKSEIQDLTSAIRYHIARRSPSQGHALAWLVYAAEIGYRYSGDEYWQTFEQETPNWLLNGNRYWIRDCYLLFQRQFGGVTPQGTWAKHFSIICWPITHAILPKDLQRQLARILFNIRHQFTGEVLESHSTLGELIVAHSWHASSRFQNLAQETHLVGQIAAALLLQGQSNMKFLIHPATLNRISEDLNREHQAREWLRGARQSAIGQAHIRGSGLLGRNTKSHNLGRPEEARAELTSLGIEPRLVLQPVNSTGNKWNVYLEIPDLSRLLLRFPQIAEVLTGSRCVVAGAAGRPLARGRLLHGPQRIILARWARADEVLLQFEQSNQLLDSLLRMECLLHQKPTWLFRIASDGLAYECRSLRVRPGERYIIVSTAPPFMSNEHLIPIELACEEVHAALLDLPDALTKGWENCLLQLGLGQAKTIEVWPAGLGAIVWDGEGNGEWFSFERPCIAIRADHTVGTLTISMTSERDLSLELTTAKPGDPIFIELPRLPVGLHVVHVAVQGELSAHVEPLSKLDVVIRIREPRPWSPGVSFQGPFIAQMDPLVPTLEQLWEGRVDITLSGPTGRKVKCRMSLFGTDRDFSTVIKQLPPMHLPVTADAWRAHFEKHFRQSREAKQRYDTTRACELMFTADELGELIIRCEREFTPLRWAVRRHGQDYVIRLLDDSGEGLGPDITRVTFETPCVEVKTAFASEINVPQKGGMYVARILDLTAAVIVPPVIRELSELGCVSHIDEATRSIDAVLRAIRFASLWGHARLPAHFLSSIRRREVQLTLVHQIARLLCGDNWSKAEAAFSEVENGIRQLSDAVSWRTEESAIGVVLDREHKTLAAATCEERVSRISSIALTFHLFPSDPAEDFGDARWFTELALRLASNPADVEAWAGERLRPGLARLMDVPTLTRAARFLVLAINHHHRSVPAPNALYLTWEWT